MQLLQHRFPPLLQQQVSIPTATCCSVPREVTHLESRELQQLQQADLTSCLAAGSLTRQLEKEKGAQRAEGRGEPQRKGRRGGAWDCKVRMSQLWEAGEGKSSSRWKRRGCPAPQVLLEPCFSCGSVPTAGQDAAAELSPGRDAVFRTTRLCRGLAVVPGHLPPGFRAPASTGRVLRRLPCSSPSPAPGRAGRDLVPCWLPSPACQQAPSDLFASSASTSEANVCLGQNHKARRIIVKYQKPLFSPKP